MTNSAGGRFTDTDTGSMSLGQLVQQVGSSLARGQALFADPPAAGPGSTSDVLLATAADVVRAGHGRVQGLSGNLPDAYGRFAADAGAALDAAADADRSLGGHLDRAAQTDRSGHAQSAAVRAAAATDTAVLAPDTGTAAGQRALIAALRTRLEQQRRLIAAHRAEDARLAAMVRSLRYRRRRPPMPLGDNRFSGIGSPAGARPAPLAGLSGFGRTHRPGSNGPGGRAADRIPNDAGQRAVRAALTRLGRPYVWGAKGPNVFDCSGLTQWAWGEAGVRLGPDTYSQNANGVPIAPGQVRAGDLIFPLDSFGEGGRSGPGHVQLAISPDYVVHAPTTGDVVRVTHMPARYLARRPMP